MSVLQTYQDSFAFNRTRTIALLDSVAELESPAAALGWRPGEGRAHIAWQLMHIGVTEEMFGVERLVDRPEAVTAVCFRPFHLSVGQTGLHNFGELFVGWPIYQ